MMKIETGADDGDWTRDLALTMGVLYHWATSAKNTEKHRLSSSSEIFLSHLYLDKLLSKNFLHPRYTRFWVFLNWLYSSTYLDKLAYYMIEKKNSSFCRKNLVSIHFDKSLGDKWSIFFLFEKRFFDTISSHTEDDILYS